MLKSLAAWTRRDFGIHALGAILLFVVLAVLAGATVSTEKVAQLTGGLILGGLLWVFLYPVAFLIQCAIRIWAAEFWVRHRRLELLGVNLPILLIWAYGVWGMFFWDADGLSVFRSLMSNRVPPDVTVVSLGQAGGIGGDRCWALEVDADPDAMIKCLLEAGFQLERDDSSVNSLKVAMHSNIMKTATGVTMKVNPLCQHYVLSRDGITRRMFIETGVRRMYLWVVNQ